MATATRTRAKNTTAAPSGEISTVDFRGESFTFPTSRAKWPTRAHQSFQRKNNPDGIEFLLGPKQWNRLNEIAPTMADFWEFFGTFCAVANAGLTEADSES